jgi:LysM repeat protein
VILESVTVGRLVGVLAVVVVLYALVTQPQNSANVARDGGSALGSVGSSLAQFVSSVAGGTLSNISSGFRSPTTDSAYTVRPGDTLSTIAATHATSPGALATRNGITDPNRINPGQQLSLR